MILLRPLKYKRAEDVHYWSYCFSYLQIFYPLSGNLSYKIIDFFLKKMYSL